MVVEIRPVIEKGKQSFALDKLPRFLELPGRKPVLLNSAVGGARPIPKLDPVVIRMLRTTGKIEV